MKKMVVVIVLLVGALLAQPSSPVIRIAQEQGTEVFYSWTPASQDFEIDVANTVLPPGFELVRDGNDLTFHLVAGGPAVHSATVTVVRERAPYDVMGWAGPKVVYRESTEVQWIVYRSSLAPFFDGWQDVVVYPSTPTP